MIARGKYKGLLQILAYNRRFYACSLAGALTAPIVAAWVPVTLRLPLYVAICGALFWMLSSLLVSHYIYDRSDLYDLRWIPGKLLGQPHTWVAIHAGLDETSHLIEELFPKAEGRVLDIYDGREMTEPSIARARELSPTLAATPADFRCLPLLDAACDAVFIIFAAHEIRRHPSRVKFFGELARVLKPSGTIILMEHLRDLPNFLGFGPGFLHFLSRPAWLRAIQEASLIVAGEFSITAFVHVFILRKHA